MKLTKNCVAAAKKILRKNGKKTRVPRVIPIPITGGMLPLIPIFVDLSALGALTGGIANVVKTVGEFNGNVPSHLGRGLYLAPNKGGSYKIEKGKGLYLAPHGGGSYKRKGTRKTLKKSPKRKKTNFYVTRKGAVRLRNYKTCTHNENTSFHRSVF